ncbi:hypothetical protein PAECIP111893_03538 [Paenibacillus plantiphilus]|uniref:ABC-2 family transporter protein n=1 Tax=Paenibacillus plantiphilus TaxID=2905650 RepID=A0ABM9CIF9_9BACL|nr:hypothetical protein [Paenibacillus plantiphilus]CAH1212445.1 hypothetical protein PAECIP111893_03538 [Paenibacillus plantiphilus]
MKMWWSLFKREISFGTEMVRSQQALVVLGFILMILSAYLGYYFKSGAVSKIWLFIIYFQVLAPVLYMVRSLNKERERSPLWYQLPMSGWKLLSAKYAAAVLELIVGFAAALSMFLVVYKLETSQEDWLKGSGFPFEEAAYFYGLLQGEGWLWIVATGIIAAMLALLVVNIYFIAMVMSSRVGRWMGWLLSLLIVSAYVALHISFEMTEVYSVLVEWVSLGGAGEDPIYAGELLWSALNLAVLVYIPAWLLDRKVEV